MCGENPETQMEEVAKFYREGQLIRLWTEEAVSLKMSTKGAFKQKPDQ